MAVLANFLGDGPLVETSMSNRLSRSLLLCLLLSATCALGQAPDPGNYSQARYEVSATRDMRVPMRDGKKLVVDIFRPDAEGKFPAILCQTPYNKNGLARRAE